jgi:type I restriction enzyme S subunit
MVENGEYPFFTCSRKIFSINKYAFDCKAVLLAGNNASGDFNVKYYEGKFNAYQRTYVITIK